MEKKEALKTIESMEIAEDKKEWMKQYALNHLENEKNPPKEKVDEPKKEFVHFEIHDVMKSTWKDRTVSTY